MVENLLGLSGCPGQVKHDALRLLLPQPLCPTPPNPSDKTRTPTTAAQHLYLL